MTDVWFLFLGAAGTWIVSRMQLRHTSGHKVIGDIDTHLSMQLSGYQLYNDKLGNVASLATLDDSYVALVAPRIKKGIQLENEWDKEKTRKLMRISVGTDGPEHVVSIWDVKYGTLQAERSLQLGDKTAYGKDKCVYSVRISHFYYSILVVLTWCVIRSLYCPTITWQLVCLLSQLVPILARRKSKPWPMPSQLLCSALTTMNPSHLWLLWARWMLLSISLVIMMQLVWPRVVMKELDNQSRA